MISDRRKIFLWQLAGFAFVTLLGSLLHFAYSWSGENPTVGAFTAVNESTWEHMKLLFFPMFLFSLFEWRFFTGVPGFLRIKLCGTLLGLLLIPVLFYTYNGMFGKSPDFINIAIFFLAALAAFVYEGWQLVRVTEGDAEGGSSPALSLSVFFLLAVLFVLFTFFPPAIPLFRDPLDGGYGIPSVSFFRKNAKITASQV